MTHQNVKCAFSAPNHEEACLHLEKIVMLYITHHLALSKFRKFQNNYRNYRSSTAGCPKHNSLYHSVYRLTREIQIIPLEQSGTVQPSRLSGFCMEVEYGQQLHKASRWWYKSQWTRLEVNGDWYILNQQIRKETRIKTLKKWKKR